MKVKKFLLFILLAFIAIVLVACGKEPEEDLNAKANEYLEKIAITYAEGDSQNSVTKDVTLGKLDVADVKVEWASDNAAITKEGKVTRGDADVNVKLTLTVTYKEKGVAKKDFPLVVKANEKIAPVAVEISGDAKMTVGADYQLTAAVKPDDASAKEVEWASDNAEVATVDANGKVTAKAVGTAKITATVKGYADVKGELAIEVVEPTADPIAKVQTFESGAEAWVQGTVVGTYARGFMVYDGTGFILVYMNDTAFTQKMGDFVEVKGAVSAYQGQNQFTNTCTITPLEDGTTYKLSATSMNDGEVTAFMGAVEYCKKIKVRVTITSASASYVNATVKDGTAAVSITYPADHTAYEVGADYDVTALALYAKEYNNVNTLYVMAEKAVKVDYGFDVTLTFKDGDATSTKVVNSLLFPVEDLPEPDAKEGYVFLGWYKGSEEAPVKVTVVNSPEPITLFARWATEAEAPLVVNPDAEEGSGQYKTISEALAAATEGATIELLVGDYAGETTVKSKASNGTDDVEAMGFIIDKKVTIIGPNANVKGTDPDRSEEANIMGRLHILANGVTINGVGFCGDGTVGVGADDVTIKNCYFDTDTYAHYNADNRMASISNIGRHARFTLADSYIITAGTSYTTECIAINGEGMDDIVITGNTFTSESTTAAGYECITAYRLYNTVTLVGNTFQYPTTAYLVRFALYGCGITYALIQDNIFDGCGDLGATLSFEHAENSATAPTYNIIHNQFLNLNERTVQIKSTAATTTVNFLYNYKNDTNVFQYLGTGYTINFDYNCILAPKSETSNVDPATQAHAMATLEELEAAYAIYKAEAERTATITLDTDGGEAIDPIVFKDVNTVVLPTPVKEGYEFLGWFDGDAEAKVEEKKDYAFKAHWVKINTITFDVDGGVAVEPIKFTDYTKVTLPVTTKEGLAFGGWTENDVLVTAITENRDYNLKAIFGEAKTITFDCAGGEPIPAMGFVDYTKVVLPTPVKANFRFDGWYNGDNKVEALTANEDITLTAHWLQLYTITFDTDGGYALEPLQFAEVEEVVLPTASKDDEVFVKWMDGENEAAITEKKDYALKAVYETFASKLAALEEGDTLVLGDAVYTATEPIVITKNNITIIGVDADKTYAKNYVFDETEAHTLFNNVLLELADGVTGFTIKGVTFSGSGHIYGVNNNADIAIENCIFNAMKSVKAGTANDGIVYFVNVDGIEIKNNTVTGTPGAGTQSPRAYRFFKVADLTFTGNVFTDDYLAVTGGDLIRVDDNGCIKGDIYVANNIFQNAGQVACHFRPFTSTEDCTFVAVNNYFNNCDGSFWLRDYVGVNNFVIAHNAFIGGGAGWDRIGSNAGYTNMVVAYNYFDNTVCQGANGDIYMAGNAIYANNFFAKDAPQITINKAAVTDYAALTDVKAIAFVGNSEFDAFKVAGLDDLYFTSLAAANDLEDGTKVVLLPGEYSGTLTKELIVTSVLEGVAAKDNADLYKGIGAATITKELVFKGVGVNVSYIAITDLGQIYHHSGEHKLVNIDNIYAYDSTFTAVAYQVNGILNTGADNTNTKVAVIQLQPSYKWVGKITVSNCVFKNVKGCAVFTICTADGYTAINNVFDGVEYDAITMRYSGGTGGNIVVNDNIFKNIGCNAFYVRSATGDYSNGMDVQIYHNTFDNVAFNYPATETSANKGCIVTRGYGEKFGVTFDIQYNKFGLCAGYLSIRDNATDTATWRAKGVHYDVLVKNNAFQVAAEGTNISTSLVGSDTNLTNVGDMLFDCNYIYTLEGETYTTVTATYDQILEASNATVYTSMAEVDAAYAAYLESLLPHPIYADKAAVLAAYIADFNAKTGKDISEGSHFNTDRIDSGDITAMMTDATLKTKWDWLYNALYEVAGKPEGPNPADAGTDYTAGAVKGFYIANLNGFFTATQNTCSAFGVTSADYTVASNVEAVLAKIPMDK